MIEKTGIPTVSTSVLREVTEAVKPPRVLFVDKPLGCPLGAACNRELQTHIIRSALELLSRPVDEPLIEVLGESPE